MSPSRKSISRDFSRAAAKDADDLELDALRQGLDVCVPLEQSLYDQEISEEDSEAQSFTEEEVEDLNVDRDAIVVALEGDSDTEARISSVSEVIQERQGVMGNYYPFELRGNAIVYRGSRTLVYEMCLAITSVNVSRNPQKQLQISFEYLSGIAVSMLLGPDTQFIRTGYPWHQAPLSLGPTSFAESIRMLEAVMPGEWALDLNSERRISDANDGGVDVVVWRRVDNREGSLIFAGNCSCGGNWLKENKHLESPSSKLQDLLSLPKPHHIVDFFSTPFHVREERDWFAARKEGLAFDRLRLGLIAESAAPSEWESRSMCLGSKMEDLIKIADQSFKPANRSSG